MIAKTPNVSALPESLNVSDFRDATQQAVAAIAPSWPLDQMIAVNPWWPQRFTPIEQVFAEQAVLSGHCPLMPSAYYLSHWQSPISEAHLAEAISTSDSALTVSDCLRALRSHSSDLPRWKPLAELCDRTREAQEGLSWQQEIQQQVSQFLALYHQYPQRFDAQGQGGEHLYQCWLDVVSQDKGIKTLTGVDLLADFAALPTQIDALIAEAADFWQPTLHDQDGNLAYCHALMHGLSGWASWQAWLDWQQQLSDSEQQDHGMGLFAILLAWDTVLARWLAKHRDAAWASIRQSMHHQAVNVRHWYHQAQQQLAPLWIWQQALEISQQRPWAHALSAQASVDTLDTSPTLQAVFCIDVRSEPMRRALEAQSERIQTLGFAGFFGLPIAYQPTDSHIHRPQLPGLLAPAVTASQTHATPERWLRMTKLGWQRSLDAPAANLGMVEAGGMLKLVSLLKRALRISGTENPLNRLSHADSDWALTRDNTPLTAAEKAELGAGILRAMGIADQLADAVLLVGHGSETCNNPHAAGLDCGACGGQTGEVNVRVLAQLLNDADVRDAMAQQGVTIPASTRFYAAMHNTTTDALDVFHAPEHTEWQTWLVNASEQARATRANQFDQAPTQPSKLKRFFGTRAKDWAQMRPEWGLCDNAALIVGPRTLSRQINLQGRSFLHDYDMHKDRDFSQLETILTAPMVVTNWINLQYFASVTAPEKFGSGNKLLHNIVGGHIGVFEGNGGDLRIGLSHQSVHDGRRYRHQPVRLSVFIAAPREAIDSILARHDDIAALANHGWLYLMQIDAQGAVWQRDRSGQWYHLNVAK
ncbi:MULTISPECIES: DUF2309 domain-containing protein [unclassified Salinivibrio]|uniref:DUF2309 domain-containing protein n=1 Tax=unclassified Salinivibrio TaxID=2636825 RepID=UPI00128D19AB|nr:MULTISPECIES: DUF2309 domain-containing protein [unclassified Salinivibrio]MPS31092.1 DUF2309 domain-containing protein [Salinivibrio sp. VYel7]MPX92493.1 DUF2309 domain-containing protein [Salinivibrio sp. VYel9]MPX97009.1 DUF2309 domain-containing protein [Salinivibrio sp. VYel6]MPX98725.1 DUF2309 domain-containing protein [Salinivibrio sp. VYel4]MPY01574.1 DUF2309 domain-containing protein [Salinivibrio sp. VYel5]